MKWILCVLLMLGLGVEAATFTSNGSLSDTQTKANSCSDGDILAIPSGSFTWASQVSITHAITIQGAGTNSTVISGSGFDIKPGSDKPTRLTGIHFSQSDWTPDYIVVLIGNCKQFRVDHCKFTKGSHQIGVNPSSGYSATGPAYGVIDHNTFFDPNISVLAADIRSGDGFTWGSQAWTAFLASQDPGTTNFIVIEDNVFVRDNLIDGAANNNNQLLYGFCGGKSVFRHNIENSTGSHGVDSIDAHGEYSLATGLDGTIMFEIYSNVFNVTTVEQLFTLRGGRHFWYYNTITTGGGGANIELWDEAGLHDSQTIQASYFLHNVFDGVVETGPLPVNGTHPYGGTMNTDYFMALPTTGQTYFPYQALIYPHPLVTAQDGGGGPVAGSPSTSISGSVIVSGSVIIH